MKYYNPPLMGKILLCFLLTRACPPVFSQTSSPSVAASTIAVNADTGQLHGGFIYPRPRFYSFLKQIPGDIKDDWGETIAKKNRLALGLTILATAALIPTDQHLVDQAQNEGRRLRIAPTTHQKTVFLGILVPYDSGSALYFIGDGELHIGLAGGFLAYGGIAGDNRALQTSSEILESYLASGIVVRALKYATGRESPYVSTRSGGRWQFFPDPVDVYRHSNLYDAFPSGHLASAMAVLTVISENYGEDYGWIGPVGYVMLGGLSFQMMNNGVHWASDYPLALFLGYTFGHIAVQKGRIPRDTAGRTAWELTPGIVGNGVGLAASRRF